MNNPKSTIPVILDKNPPSAFVAVPITLNDFKTFGTIVAILFEALRLSFTAIFGATFIIAFEPRSVAVVVPDNTSFVVSKPDFIFSIYIRMDNISKINGNIFSDLDVDGNGITNLGFPVNDGDAIRLDYALNSDFFNTVATNVSGEIASVSNLTDLLTKNSAKMLSQLNCKNVKGISGRSADGTVYQDSRPYKVINYGLFKSMSQVFNGNSNSTLDLGSNRITSLKNSGVVTKQSVDSYKCSTLYLRLNGFTNDSIIVPLNIFNIDVNGTGAESFTLKTTPADIAVFNQQGNIIGYATPYKTFVAGSVANFQQYPILYGVLILLERF